MKHGFSPANELGFHSSSLIYFQAIENSNHQSLFGRLCLWMPGVSAQRARKAKEAWDRWGVHAGASERPFLSSSCSRPVTRCLPQCDVCSLGTKNSPCQRECAHQASSRSQRGHHHALTQGLPPRSECAHPRDDVAVSGDIFGSYDWIRGATSS